MAFEWKWDPWGDLPASFVPIELRKPSSRTEEEARTRKFRLMGRKRAWAKKRKERAERVREKPMPFGHDRKRDLSQFQVVLLVSQTLPQPFSVDQVWNAAPWPVPRNRITALLAHHGVNRGYLEYLPTHERAWNGAPSPRYLLTPRGVLKLQEAQERAMTHKVTTFVFPATQTPFLTVLEASGVPTWTPKCDPKPKKWFERAESTPEAGEKPIRRDRNGRVIREPKKYRRKGTRSTDHET